MKYNVEGKTLKMKLPGKFFIAGTGVFQFIIVQAGEFPDGDKSIF